MHEYVKMSARAGTRLVQQPCARSTKPFNGGVEVRHFQRDMMEPFSSLVEKFSDHRVCFRGLQQLDSRLTHWQHGYIHFFLLDRLAQSNAQAKLVAIESQRLVEGPHRDTQMIDLKAV